MGALSHALRAARPGEASRLAALDDAIRAPLPLSTAVGIVGSGPDAPTALVGGLLAGVLAARRPHRVLAVAAQSAQSVQPARPGIAGYAGLTDDAQPVDKDVLQRATARTGAEATAGLARTPGRSWALDLADEPARWWDAVAPIARFFDFVLTDWGTGEGSTGADWDDARATSAVLLVVCAANRAALQAGVDLREALRSPTTSPLLVVHDTGNDTQPGLREATPANDGLWLPADRGLDALDRRRLRYGTTRAVLELAAAVVAAAAAHSRTEAPR